MGGLFRKEVGKHFAQRFFGIRRADAVVRMSVELHFNERRGEGLPGSSLFDCAETLGVRVPTSCHKLGLARAT